MFTPQVCFGTPIILPAYKAVANAKSRLKGRQYPKKECKILKNFRRIHHILQLKVIGVNHFPPTLYKISVNKEIS